MTVNNMFVLVGENELSQISTHLHRLCRGDVFVKAETTIIMLGNSIHITQLAGLYLGHIKMAIIIPANLRLRKEYPVQYLMNI